MVVLTRSARRRLTIQQHQQDAAERAAYEALPVFSEEIMTNIFLRLPVKSLIRFKSVCKQWKVMFTSSNFLKKHYHQQTICNNQLPVYQTQLSVYCKTEGEGQGKREDQWVEVLSSEPRVFMYHNFLSKEECEYLINVAKPHMVRSRLFDRENIYGEGKVSSDRTSTGMSLRRGYNKTISDIEKRIADYTSIPVDHGENLHVLNYEVGQKIVPHYDYNTDERVITKNKKMVTFLMYLSDVEEGGETGFPIAKKRGLVVKPKLGDAVLFWSVHPDGTQDLTSLHEGCPVVRGNKWSCTKWMHAEPLEIAYLK